MASSSRSEKSGVLRSMRIFGPLERGFEESFVSPFSSEERSSRRVSGRYIGFGIGLRFCVAAASFGSSFSVRFAYRFAPGQLVYQMSRCPIRAGRVKSIVAQVSSLLQALCPNTSDEVFIP